MNRDQKERKHRVLTQSAASVTQSISDAIVIKNEDLFFLSAGTPITNTAYLLWEGTEVMATAPHVVRSVEVKYQVCLPIVSRNH